MIAVFVILGVVLLVCGIALLFKGYTQIPSAGTVVPLVEHEQLQKTLESAKSQEEQLKKQLDTITVQFQETQAQWQQAKKDQETLKSVQASETEAKVKVQELELKLDTVALNADRQVQEALSTVAGLQTENQALKSQVEQFLGIDPAAVEQLTKDNEALKARVEEQSAKIIQLDKDLSAARESQSGLTEARTSLEDVTKENQKLKDDLAQALARVSELEQQVQSVNKENGERLTQATRTIEELQAELKTLQTRSTADHAAQGVSGEHVVQLKTQIAELQQQIEKDGVRIRQLEGELVVARQGAASEAARAPQAGASAQLREDVDRIRRTQDHELAQSALTIENLRFENQSLMSKVKNAEFQIQQITMDLAQMRGRGQKEETSAVLEQEMEVKRICGELKMQMDFMQKTIDELKAENRSLQDRQAKARAEAPPAPAVKISGDQRPLEEEVRKLKEFNARLLEKEKMIQSELTKSRAQAMGLQKMCEQFKVQLEKTG
ncbi:MAG: hypothetical protein Q8Q08_12185 [Candidatus Omnitrophota bacterium]|nr:hypothetical protein [Candidatus Omnitrophota bacterium]MDZ4243453.1 hypothetical protein [Candidatus Omnitrophota bacterium]